MKHHNPFMMIGSYIGAVIPISFLSYVYFFSNKVFGCPPLLPPDSEGFLPITGPCLINLNIPPPLDMMGSINPFIPSVIFYGIIGFLIGWAIQTLLSKKTRGGVKIGK